MLAIALGPGGRIHFTAPAYYVPRPEPGAPDPAGAEIFRLFLQHGVTRESQQLILSVWSNPGTVRAMLDHGAAIHAPDENGEGGLTAAVEAILIGRLSSQCDRRDVEALCFLGAPGVAPALIAASKHLNPEATSGMGEPRISSWWIARPPFRQAVSSGRPSRLAIAREFELR